MSIKEDFKAELPHLPYMLAKLFIGTISVLSVCYAVATDSRTAITICIVSLILFVWTNKKLESKIVYNDNIRSNVGKDVFYWTILLFMVAIFIFTVLFLI